MKVIVVGAAGFLGRAATRALAGRGHAVIAVDLAPPWPDAPVAEWLQHDLAEGGLPAATLAGADALVHLAWRNDPGRGNSRMADDAATNVAGAVRVFEQAAAAGVRRIVYASSGGTVYGDAPAPTPETAPIAPIGGYGAGKAAAELYLHALHHASGVETCTLRIANPYGPGQHPNRGQGFIATAVARTLAGEPVQIFGSGAIARDFLFIDDVAAAIALAVEDATPNIVLNVGFGRDITLAALLELIFEAAGRHTEIERLPARAMDIPRMALDIGRIATVLGWRPTTDLQTGLAETVRWVRGLSR